MYGPYPAIVTNVHDGDTMTLAIDLGFGIITRANCRIFGINAPELSTPEGKQARDYALTLVKPDDQVVVVSKGWDKYGGRFDGVVTLLDGRDFAKLMLDSGHAVPFHV